MQVRRTLVDVDLEQPASSHSKTARSRRQIALDPTTVTALRTLRRSQAAHRLSIGGAYVDHDLVFCRSDGKPLHPDRFSKSFVEQVDRLGLPRLSVHGLRHTWATLALQAGVHPKVVQERLGHSTISITLDIYSHVSPAMESDAAERVAALIFGSGA